MFSSFYAPSARGRGAVRLAVATLVSGLVAVTGVMAGAGTAVADGTAQNQGGATATIGGLKTYGAAVIHDPAGDQGLSAGLFEMSVEGGGMLQTYCVDIRNPTQKDAKYHETPWSGTSLGANKDAGKIRWILQNSYPQVNDLAALAAKAGVKGGLTEQDAAAGTQVAIWRHSDDVDVDAVDPQAEKLADYLEKNARDMAEPKASLTLDPPAVSGRSGERLGPVTVHTNADSVTVTPPADSATSGVTIVDGDGKAVTSAADGSQVFFEVPEDAAAGSAELTVQASTTVPVGRAFASESRSQTQILAGSSESTVSATASATWAEQGPIPALSAVKNCAAGGVDLTADNKGDEDFTFKLMGIEHTIAAGESRTVTIPLQEDQAYDFTIEAPGGFQKRFAGVLDCRTKGSDSGDSTQLLTEPSPATVGGTTPDTNLAETGSSGATPVIGGTAIALVVIGGGVLVLVRNKKTPGQG
ncbi:Cys-Gln thioester bond-forming surface protein [Streptomyces sp. DG2A-72]|uniref:Cys-Gln thioester bond-forming surface protein n=1 Tax=Streptomyces sp. DG2A-72 TaxID=3051386 RepID=UPI00265C6103|nr:Cys-Gln thioester bond-forming surface protein [Streptomyces sp. DG2A-72]MDO0933202.1 Cys-Gln thioester bond-forming surface protein [Streptomyces sp. DG2A-72]